MVKPRIEHLDIDRAKEAAARVGISEQMAELSVFRVLLQHPKLAQALNGLLGTLLFDGNRLDPRLRELIILRIAWVTGSEYEWTQHWRFARQIEIPERDLLEVRDWRASSLLQAADRAVLAATDEVLEGGVILKATWEECERYIEGAEARLELVVAIGNWNTFSILLRSLEIPLEEGVSPWPPDGRRPESAS